MRKALQTIASRCAALYVFATYALRGRDGHLSFSKLILVACLVMRWSGRASTTDAALFIAASYGFKGLVAFLQRASFSATSIETHTESRSVTETIERKEIAARRANGEFEENTL